MKKRFIAVLSAAVIAGSLLAGCGSTSNNTATETATTESEAAETASEETQETVTYPDSAYIKSMNVDELVELPDYTEIPVEAELIEVTDEEVEAAIQSQLSYDETLEEVTDRDTVQDGDTVNIDYVGKLNGEAFDGGTAAGVDLVIGSNLYIEGFESGLIGHKVGETVDLTLTFPEEYSNTDLAGQETVFTVTINSISVEVVPELNDEYVAAKSLKDDDGNDVATVEEYRAYIRAKLEANAQEDYDDDIRSGIVQYLTENSTFKQDLPADMVTRMNDLVTNAYSTYASYYGIDLATFMYYFFGCTEDTYEDEIRGYAEEYTKQLIVMEAVAQKEGLSITDEELQEELAAEAADNGYSDVNAYTQLLDTEALREELVGDKVIEALRDRVVVTAPVDTAETEDAAETTTEEAATEEAATEEAATEEAAEAKEADAQ